MLLAQIDAAKAVVDQAATASDRWLFLAALAIIIVGGVACIRWLVNSLEKKDAAHASANERKDAVNAAAFKRLEEEHAKERSDWRAMQLEAKAQFLDALKQQRVDFREELSLERTSTATMAKTVERLATQLAAASPAS